jgi:hypothetical protein
LVDVVGPNHICVGEESFFGDDDVDSGFYDVPFSLVGAPTLKVVNRLIMTLII